MGQHGQYGGRPLDVDGLKALAHPLRVRLLRLIAQRGPSTASALGRELGESSGTTSYHLRKLAEQGLIVEAEEVGTGRDRYWTRPEGPLLIDSKAFRAREDTRDAVNLLLSELQRSRLDLLQEWEAQGDRWPEEWQDGSEDSGLILHLRPAAMKALSEELVAVVTRYVRDHEHPAEGTRPVHVGLEVFPVGPPPDDGGNTQAG